MTKILRPIWEDFQRKAIVSDDDAKEYHSTILGDGLYRKYLQKRDRRTYIFHWEGDLGVVIRFQSVSLKFILLVRRWWWWRSCWLKVGSAELFSGGWRHITWLEMTPCSFKYKKKKVTTRGKYFEWQDILRSSGPHKCTEKVLKSPHVLESVEWRFMMFWMILSHRSGCECIHMVFSL